jgi:hypothetical protein
MHRALLWTAIAATSACSSWNGSREPKPPTPVENTTPASAQPASQPEVVSDPLTEQKLARAELRLLEKEAQVEELRIRLDEARQEVVRAMAKLQSSATRAEAASGIAEAEIALQPLRDAAATAGVEEASQLMKHATAEFDQQNYGGALYLANQAKSTALAARGGIASVERQSLRQGEVPFALPLALQTTGRANVRDGPGSGFKVLMTLPAGAPLTGYSYSEQWVRITEESGRSGWIYQGLIGRRP